ncbi:MAG: hypothetical protein HZC29_03200 [Thaumarchaeota archaeon]|nr:hypothetical protein [Nitrososphaerota archaeon]
MKEDFLCASLDYYGISPWEIEVVYGLFSERFHVQQNEISEQEPDFVSVISLSIPLAFNEEFFKWFEYQRWDKIKYIFKEMKRRRGKDNALKINIDFIGMPKIGFSLDVEDKSWFDNALEKLDFVIELLPYQLNFDNADDITRVIYKFDVDTRKWKLYTLFAKDKKFVLVNNSWKIVI